MSKTERTEHQIPGRYQRKFYHQVKWQDEYGWSVIRTETLYPAEAEVVSSELVGNNMHAPALDIDIPAYLVPSATPGHTHLYFDRLMTWRQYKRLLKALARAGIIEKGYMKASLRRGHSSVRVPWRKKETESYPVVERGF